MKIHKKIPVFKLGSFSFIAAAIISGALIFTPYSSTNRTGIVEPDNKKSQANTTGQAVSDLSKGSVTTTTTKNTDESVILSTQKLKISGSSNNRTFSNDEGTFPLRSYKPLSDTNDPAGSQWWTHKTQLDSTWELGTEGDQTIVAVIDTGFALKHEEFDNRWARNSSETGETTRENPSTDVSLNCTDQEKTLDKSCNLIDDDGNGYVDDVLGWDFVGNDNSPQAGETDPDGKSVFHGTTVAGVLAATGNNQKGIAGVDWRTKILPIQAIGDNENGTTITVAKGIYYAVERGANVINLSLGSVEEDSYVREAVDYAIDNNVVVVAAAGNDGCDCMSYPANYPEVVSVGSVGESNKRSDFSSYGTNLDILAPGENISSPTWTEANPTAAYRDNLAGSSYSSPFISGLLSRQRAMDGQSTWGELVASLNAGAILPSGESQSPSPSIGYGSSNALNTLRAIEDPKKVYIRYTFKTESSTQALNSALSRQCDHGESSSAQLYVLEKNGTRRFTIDTLEAHRSNKKGWTTKRLIPVCVGLSGDVVEENRFIDLDRELFNTPPPKAPLSPETSIHGLPLYVDPNKKAEGRPTEITSQPTAIWLGSWNDNVTAAADMVVSASEADRSLATLVLYNIPHRDCGGYSSGGASNAASYAAWIDDVARGIGERQALVILEPDALSQTNCLSSAQATERYATLKSAVATLSAKTKALVYIDAGHSSWIPPKSMATRLKQAGIAGARGFSLNVSNFETTLSNEEYGNSVNTYLDEDKKIVIDTSRNGNGPGDSWCNPAGRKLGLQPTTKTTGSIDAYLWIKLPGESDGTCNGGPEAGTWWQDYAEDLLP